MAITDSERIMRDTLHRMVVNNEIQYYHRENTPKFFKEKIDFYVIDNIGRSHLIETKQSGSSKSISPSQFKNLQKSVLTSEVLNKLDACTRAWIHVNIFDGDTTKRAKAHWDYHFLVPGWWIGEETISVDNITAQEGSAGVNYLAMYEDREWMMASEEYGRTRNGNDSLGFKEVPVLNNE